LKRNKFHSVSFYWESFLNSYSQIFFAENKILAIILVCVSFINWWTGLSGLIAVVTALILAEILNYDKLTLRKGLFSFNSLLVGLGIGTYFSPAIQVLLLIIIASAITFFSTVFLMGMLRKYGLPFLSVPFLMGMWLLILSFPAFLNMQVNEDALYPSNHLFKLGGLVLVKIVDGLNFFFLDTGFDTYFLSLGAIFFQFSLLAGLLIAIGLFIHSRVHFLFSLIGFFIAFWLYEFLGVYSGALNYTYYGFNFILSAIAIGGYFLIPSRQSLLWSVLVIPILVITTIGSDRLFAVFGLSVFSLPFNVVVIGILYAFKIRYDQTKAPILTYIQQKNPETNAYLFDSLEAKEFSLFNIPIHLPFLGEWTVNQGHEGKYTHKDFYKYAWDFIIKDATSNLEYMNDGYLVTDYYCYDKPVIASGNGVVVAVVNNIEDNEIGFANVQQNWGNTIVIKHEEFLYSKMSHLKMNSIKVSVGDSVIQGQEIGRCGNSGRSPYPHLHFQLQSSGTIGSPTIFWPIANFIHIGSSQKKFIEKGIPSENSIVSNIQTAAILSNAFKWNPGDVFEIEQSINENKVVTFVIENEIDSYNQTYLYCVKTKAKLFYVNNGKTFSALNYIGSKKSPLYFMFCSFYKLVFSAEQISVKTKFPIHQLYKTPLLTLQDLLVPFGIFLKGVFQLEYSATEEIFNPKKIELLAKTSKWNDQDFIVSKIEIQKTKEIHISLDIKNSTKIQFIWRKKLGI